MHYSAHPCTEVVGASKALGRVIDVSCPCVRVACLLAFGLWIGLLVRQCRDERRARRRRSRPGAGDADLLPVPGDRPRPGQYGYVEEEYFVSGDAFRYIDRRATTGTKNLTGGPNNDGAFPYKTRIVVRRPIDPTDFNGTTVLEWYNVTAGFDVEWNWFNDPEYMMRHGYAWVGVSAQNSGVNQLRNWNATRYGTAGGNLNVNPTGAGTDDALLRHLRLGREGAAGGTRPDPMGGLRPTRSSPPASRSPAAGSTPTTTTIQPIHELIDSFLITVATASCAPTGPRTR